MFKTLFLLFGLIFLTGCASTYFSKKPSYAMGQISTNQIVVYKPFSKYFESRMAFLKEIDSVNNQQKIDEFNSLFISHLRKFGINQINDSLIFPSELYWDYEPWKKGITITNDIINDNLVKYLKLPIDDRFHVVNFVKFNHVIMPEVGASRIESQLCLFFFVFKNNKLVHRRIYSKIVTDGFGITGLQPYFLKSQMNEVIDKASIDFLKHIKPL